MQDRNFIAVEESKKPHVVILGTGASYASCPDGDAYGNKIPLMNNFITVIPGLKELLIENSVEINSNDFESIFSDMITHTGKQELVHGIKNLISKYFEMMKLPLRLTLYDYLILSLREKDVIATFNWDPLIIQAYERNRHLTKLPNLVFLHGNVSLGICHQHKIVDYRGCQCSECEKLLEPVEILYPIKQKNYSENPYIEDQWDFLRDRLRKAYMLTIFGYSAPKTDVEAKKLLLEAWKGNDLYEFTELEIIDIKSKDELHDNWSEFRFGGHYKIHQDISNSYIFKYPRRSCEALYAHTMINEWIEDRSFPDCDNFDDLYDYVSLLLTEERDFDITPKSYNFKRM